MLYSVFMEVTNISGAEKNLELFEYDKGSKDLIIDEVIIPYLEKRDMQFNGYFLKADNVVRIVVKKTDERIKIISDRENASNPPGFLFFKTKEDVVKGDSNTVDVTKEIFDEARSVLALSNKVKENNVQAKTVDRSKVFIVHGHDEVVKLSVARFIEKLGLVPIILHEQASKGKTIIEKIEDYSNVGFGIVLYTPCDFGKPKNNEDLKPRARQNVVFEHGYLMAKIGRNNVCALVKEDVEKPNDVSGIVYVNYDSGGGWHTELLKELKSSGYDVDANLLFN